jgi:hypothetical protein
MQLRSLNDKNFGARYPGILKALAPIPDETVIDGEVVALDPEGRPPLNANPTDAVIPNAIRDHERINVPNR